MTKGRGKSEDGTKTVTGGVIAEGMDKVEQDGRKRRSIKGVHGRRKLSDEGT